MRPSVVELVSTLDEEVLEKRLMSKVFKSNSGCWEWTGWTNPKGYPMMDIRSTQVQASRVMYVHKIGPLERHQRVVHTCGDVACVNPEHLVAVAGKGGSFLKRIRPVGEEHWKAKVTEADVREMRRLHTKEGKTYAELAEEYDISLNNVYSICTRRSWKHVK